MLLRFLCHLALGLVLLLPAGAEERVPSSAAEVTLSFAPVVRATTPAVVNIYVKAIVARRASPFANDPFFRNFLETPVIPRVENSLGSGVILSPDGLVVTNTHVVGQAAEIRVVLSDGREFAADVVLSDAEDDLTLLQLREAADLPYLELADSDAVEVGDLVLAIGNPFGVGQTVSSGIVSGLARSGGGMATRRGYFIQTDAAINPGNSGGALVDMSGRLLGVNTSILTRSGGSNGIGFAIPANLVGAYMDQARAGRRELLRPWSGIRVQPVVGALAEAFGQALPGGVVIADIHPQSPFAEAGMQVGDVITALGDAPVNSAADLDFQMMVAMSERKVPVRFARADTTDAVEITIGPAPAEPRVEPVLIGGRTPLSGVEVSALNPAIIDSLDLPLNATGVVILSIGGYAERLGLGAGDILVSLNGRSIETPADLEAAIRTAGRDWDIGVLRQGQRLTLRFRF